MKREGNTAMRWKKVSWRDCGNEEMTHWTVPVCFLHLYHLSTSVIQGDVLL